MDVRLRCRVLSLGLAASVLVACAKEHSENTEPKPPADAGASGRAGASAAEGGSAAPTKPRAQPKPGKSGVLGTKAVAMLEPVDPTPERFNVRGTATFSVTPSGVDLAVLLRDCLANDKGELVILEGSDCSSDTLAGPRWDPPRGEGIPTLTCVAFSESVGGQARLGAMRSSDDDKPWSIGTGKDSELLGHALVLYDVATSAPLACGVITLVESEPPPEPPSGAADVSLLGRAQVAGMCLGASIVRTSEHPCPDPKELTECAQAHCQLDTCVERCRDYLACTTKEEDPCSVAYTCPVENACAQCSGEITMCVFTFCTDAFTCAAPATPDGACSKLKACCDLQGDKAESCRVLVDQIERLSGDPSCKGAMHDVDFFSHLPVPCMFE